ncbi:hypothetical protein Tco_0190525 [Tanacetum coccineum]
MALESNKLNYLIKDVKQKGNNQGIQKGNSSKGQGGGSERKGKVFNMVWTSKGGCKRKLNMGYKEEWMKAPIMFPPISYDEASDEPLIIEAEVEGYLVKRILMDEGAAVQVMFEHCVGFKRLQDILRVTAAQLQLLSDYYCWKEYADKEEIKD